MITIPWCEAARLAKQLSDRITNEADDINLVSGTDRITEVEKVASLLASIPDNEAWRTTKGVLNLTSDLT